jgi:hypothetical protein
MKIRVIPLGIWDPCPEISKKIFGYPLAKGGTWLIATTRAGLSLDAMEQFYLVKSGHGNILPKLMLFSTGINIFMVI